MDVSAKQGVFSKSKYVESPADYTICGAFIEFPNITAGASFSPFLTSP